MSNDRRSSAPRATQPIHLLRETRFLSREELLRELRGQQVTGPCTPVTPAGAQGRKGSE